MAPCRGWPCRDGPCRGWPCRDGPCRGWPCRDGPCRGWPCRDGPCRGWPCRDGPCSLAWPGPGRRGGGIPDDRRQVAPGRVGRRSQRTEATGQEWPGDRFLRHRGLIALTAGGSIAEVVVLGWLAPAARPIAPQVTAIAPLAVFHDLRWLFGAGWGWPGFLLGFAALTVARSAVSTAATILAWPRDQPRPRLPATFGRFLVFTVIASVLLAPVVTLLFGVALVPFSWPFLAALPALLLIAVPLAHGGLLGDWWRRLPPPQAIGWLIVSFATLSAAAAAIGAHPLAAGIPAAGLAGLVNGRAWFGVAAAVTRREARSPMPGRVGVRAGRRPGWRCQDVLSRRVWPGPLSPVAAAAAIAVVVGGTRVIFALATATPTIGGSEAIPGRAAAHAPGAGPGAPGRVITRGAGSGAPGRHRGGRPGHPGVRLILLRTVGGAVPARPAGPGAAVLLSRPQRERPAAAVRSWLH